jgi:hypothetical protein
MNLMALMSLLWLGSRRCGGGVSGGGGGLFDKLTATISDMARRSSDFAACQIMARTCSWLHHGVLSVCMRAGTVGGCGLPLRRRSCTRAHWASRHTPFWSCQAMRCAGWAWSSEAAEQNDVMRSEVVRE